MGKRAKRRTRGEGKGGVGERELGDRSRRGGGQGGERSACAADARWKEREGLREGRNIRGEVR